MRLGIHLPQIGRKAEPDGAPREASQILHKVFAALRADGITKHAVAEALKVHAEDVDELVFGLALTSLDGTAPARVQIGRAFDRRLHRAQAG